VQLRVEQVDQPTFSSNLIVINKGRELSFSVTKPGVSRHGSAGPRFVQVMNWNQRGAPNFLHDSSTGTVGAVIYDKYIESSRA
jgi:hypothetical protein